MEYKIQDPTLEPATSWESRDRAKTFCVPRSGPRSHTLSLDCSILSPEIRKIARLLRKARSRPTATVNKRFDRFFKIQGLTPSSATSPEFPEFKLMS